ncbi:Os04g0406300 [Oryza sativa Japonica Group]|uniref:Os04g0406300 protein n=2 Tax=Oryza sativa subsp. japonica TaxID=39947 RepID=Q0JDF8_ORYSJ|nr:Os04g0406300 [Oryza sativa Japonica Group]BAS89084.1 Os04g0406300 [Oryza sativa Japonica Group]|eukprot:NP_001052715.1 Os04g0406300 [Oryza sativa Japonica Group]
MHLFLNAMNDWTPPPLLGQAVASRPAGSGSTTLLELGQLYVHAPGQAETRTRHLWSCHGFRICGSWTREEEKKRGVNCKIVHDMRASF